VQGEITRVDVSAIPEPGGWEDPLTGLEGPDFWQRVLVAEIARSARYKRNLTVVVAELEGVLDMADTWGVEAGRHAIREAAQCLRRTSRTSDHCTRIGLTRFGVILTETDEIAAINYVERVREAGPRSMPRGGEHLRFSFGWASPKQGEAPESVVRRADTRLMAELLR
jgi:diguanylate cyclase (GGDEF)-like protein